MTAWRQLGGVKKLDNLWPASEAASSCLPCRSAQGKEEICFLVLFSVSMALCSIAIRLLQRYTAVTFVSKGKSKELMLGFHDSGGQKGLMKPLVLGKCGWIS